MNPTTHNDQKNKIKPPSQTWLQGPKATFDLETTGPDPLTALTVTASIIVVNSDQNIISEHEWLINPGIPIPEQATAVHGITTEEAKKNGKDPVQALIEINEVLSSIWAQGLPVIAYNGSYDFTVLSEEGKKRGAPAVIPRFVIDPYIIDKKVDPYRKGKRTLEVTANHYGVILDNAHTSAADALATIEIAEALFINYPELELSLPQLYSAQQLWAKEQAKSLEEYFRAQGRNEKVNKQWPVRNG